MAVYFSTEERGNKKGDYLIRLSWHHKGERYQTTIGLTTKTCVSKNRVISGGRRNSKNMSVDEINLILEKIEKFIYACETYAMKIGVSLMNGTMRGLFKDFKASNYANEQDIIQKWITVSPSNGLYWHKYDGHFYKKLCEATDSSDSSTKYVIYQELFGKSRIFSMLIEEFYGMVEYEGQILCRFAEVSPEIALEENAEWKEVCYLDKFEH